MKTITSEKKDILSAIADIMHDIFDRDYYADKAIEYFFRQHRMTDDDIRQIIAEGVYQLLREGGYFQAIAASDTIYDTVCAWYENTIEKKDFSGSVDEAVMLLKSKVQYFLFHVYIKREEAKYFENLKREATDEEIALQVDFAENFNIK